MGHSSSRPFAKNINRIYPSNTSNENPQSINTMKTEENNYFEEKELARKIIGWEIDINGYSAIVIDYIDIMQGVSNLYLVQFSFGLKMIFPIRLSNDIQLPCEDYIPIKFTYKILEKESVNKI